MLTRFGIFCCDYWLASGLFLAAVFVAWSLLRQPVQRATLARAALAGLILLAPLCFLSADWKTTLPFAEIAAEPLEFPKQKTRSRDILIPPRQTDPHLAGSQNFETGMLASPFLRETRPDRITPSETAAPLDLESTSFQQSSQTEELKATEEYLSPASYIALMQIVALAIVFIRLSIGICYAFRLCRESTFFGKIDGIDILCGDKLSSPVVLGILRPKILLPRSLCELADENRLRLSLAHEQAHLRHGDLNTLAFWQLLTPLCALQPLFWILKQKLRREQEFLADAAVIDAIPNRTEYVRELLHWAAIGRKKPKRLFISLLGLASMVGICEEKY